MSINRDVTRKKAEIVGSVSHSKVYIAYGCLIIKKVQYDYKYYFYELDNYHLSFDKNSFKMELRHEKTHINLQFFTALDFYYVYGCLCDFDTIDILPKLSRHDKIVSDLKDIPEDLYE